MKKTLKTILIAGLLFCVILTMAGCGKQEEENKGTTNKSGNEQVVNNEQVSRGEWKENQYTNDFAKVKFNLPEGWAIASDEDIAKLMNIGVEMLNVDQQKLAELAEQTSLYCMVANEENTGASVMVMLEKPTLKVTSELYLSTVKQQLESVESMKYNIGEQYSKTISGEEYTAVDATIENYPVEQRYYVRTEGDYIVAIIITTTAEGQLDTILNCFE